MELTLKLQTMSQNINKLIDFTLEVTNGCQFNCTGCNVDKEGNSWPSADDFLKMEALADDLNSNGFPAMNLAIGPTDIMTSVNRDVILTSPEIKSLAKKFMKTAINCAFLDPFDDNYINMGKKLNWLLEGKMVKFVIPFEAFHIDNEAYINRIRRRRDLVLQHMPDVTHTKTYLIINYETSSIYDKENNKNITEELVLKVYESPLLKDFATDLVLSHARTDLRDPINGDKFIAAAKTLKAIMSTSREKYGHMIDIAEVKPDEGKDWDIFYKAGKLYMTPFLLEGLASFDEVFEVKGDWTFNNLYNFYSESMIDQISWAHEHGDECKTCQFVGPCAERGIHNLMKICGTTQCISPAKNVEKHIVWNR